MIMFLNMKLKMIIPFSLKSPMLNIENNLDIRPKCVHSEHAKYPVNLFYIYIKHIVYLANKFNSHCLKHSPPILRK